MPILPENKARYPHNWIEIRAEILKRAGERCEFCGAHNRWFAVRNAAGDLIYQTREPNMQLETFHVVDGLRAVKIVLTIAHLDHTPEHCDPKNLKALCQRCHNRYDRPHRDETRRRNSIKRREIEGQLSMVGVFA